MGRRTRDRPAVKIPTIMEQLTTATTRAKMRGDEYYKVWKDAYEAARATMKILPSIAAANEAAWKAGLR